MRSYVASLRWRAAALLRASTRLPAAIAGLSLVLALALSSTAQAAPTAAQLFAQGEKEFSESHFAEAARWFERAHKEEPHVSVLFNAAVSWDHAGRKARSATAYQKALAEEGLRPSQAEEAERRLSALAGQLAFVRISQPVGGFITVAYIENESIPARFFLRPGSYEVHFTDEDGDTTETPISVRAGEPLKLVLKTIERPAAAAPQRPFVSPITDNRSEPPASLVQEILGWSSLGIGLAASASAIYMGLEGLSARERYNNSGRRDLDAYRDAADYRTGANIGWGSAALFGLGGGILLLNAPTVRF